MTFVTSSRRAFTLLEVILVMGLLTLVITGIYQVWHTSRTYSSSFEERIGPLMEAQQLFRKLEQEVRSARRILYPLPGSGDQKGLWIIDAEGKAIGYGLEAEPGGAANSTGGSLYRYDKASGERTRIGKLRNMRVRVPVSAPGREPGIVHVQVVMDGPKGVPLFLVNSLRPACRDVRCPITR